MVHKKTQVPAVPVDQLLAIRRSGGDGCKHSREPATKNGIDENNGDGWDMPFN